MEGERGQWSQRLRGAAWEGTGKPALEHGSGWGGRRGRRSKANATPSALLQCRERVEGDGAREGEDTTEGDFPGHLYAPLQKVEGLIPGLGTEIPRAVWDG